MIGSSTAGWASGADAGTGIFPAPGGSDIRVAGKIEESIVDGPGLRYVLFTQGCPHRCPGCHNPETHDPFGGQPVAVSEIVRDIRRNPITRGVTFSGGEPFLQSGALAPLANELKRQGYHLMAYTGYLIEELLARPGHRAFLACLDVVVDGPFVLEKRSLELRFRGSSNQRFIDVPASLAAQRAVECDM